MNQTTEGTELRRHRDDKTITEREYEALFLYEIKGLSLRAIAVAHGIGLSTVADRVRRARQKINLKEAS